MYVVGTLVLTYNFLLEDESKRYPTIGDESSAILIRRATSGCGQRHTRCSPLIHQNFILSFISYTNYHVVTDREREVPDYHIKCITHSSEMPLRFYYLDCLQRLGNDSTEMRPAMRDHLGRDWLYIMCAAAAHPNSDNEVHFHQHQTTQTRPLH